MYEIFSWIILASLPTSTCWKLRRPAVPLNSPVMANFVFNVSGSVTCDHCPLGGQQLTNVFCGLGGTRCPDGYSCEISPIDAYAVCCPKPGRWRWSAQNINSGRSRRNQLEKEMSFTESWKIYIAYICYPDVLCKKISNIKICRLLSKVCFFVIVAFLVCEKSSY